jgi:hypothetical protein
MSSNRRKARMIASLTFAVLATFVQVPTSTDAGPISDMLARHRAQRQMKLPPMSKPFSTKPVKDLSVRTASLSDKFKKRFSFMKKPASSGTIPMNKDYGVVKTSQ